MKACDNIGRSRVGINLATQPLGIGIPILNWRPEDMREHDAEAIRIALFENARRPATNAAWIVKARALVSFGAGAIRHDVEVDFKNGVQITVPATAISVSAKLIEREGTPVFAVEDSLADFGAILTAGDGTTYGAPTFTTERLVLPAAGGTIVVPVPAFAHGFTLAVPTPLTFAPAVPTIVQSGSGDGAGAILSTVVPDTEVAGAVFIYSQREPYTLVGGARSLVFTKAAGAEFTFEVVFHLGL